MTADVSSSSIVIAASIIACVVGILSRSFLTTFRDFADARRRIAVERDDADIAERDRQIAYLQGVADERRRELDARDQLAYRHQAWDRAKMAHPEADHGPPPPLWPTAEPAPPSTKAT